MMPKIAFTAFVMVAMLVVMVASDAKKDGKKDDKYAKNHPHKYHLDFLGSYFNNILERLCYCLITISK